MHHWRTRRRGRSDPPGFASPITEAPPTIAPDAGTRTGSSDAVRRSAHFARPRFLLPNRFATLLDAAMLRAMLVQWKILNKFN